MKVSIDKEKSQKKETDKLDDDVKSSRKYELNPIHNFKMNMLIENYRARSKL